MVTPPGGYLLPLGGARSAGLKEEEAAAAAAVAKKKKESVAAAAAAWPRKASLSSASPAGGCREYPRRVRRKRGSAGRDSLRRRAGACFHTHTCPAGAWKHRTLFYQPSAHHPHDLIALQSTCGRGRAHHGARHQYAPAHRCGVVWAHPEMEIGARDASPVLLDPWLRTGRGKRLKPRAKLTCLFDPADTLYFGLGYGGCV